MSCKFRARHIQNQNSLGKMMTNSKPFLKMNFYTMNKLIKNNTFQLNNDLLSFLYSFQEMKKEPRQKKQIRDVSYQRAEQLDLLEKI